MDELMERQESLPAVLDGYVQQGQMFLFNAAQNLLQFGRVLTEAKPLVPRGKFEAFVRENFRMSERTAQQYMAVWKRFGGKAQFETVQFSSLQKMLALPEGEEEQFAADHDLKGMTARQVEAAVKQAREEERKSFEKEKAELENRVRTETIAQSKEAILEARKELDDAKISLSGIAEERAGWGGKAAGTGTGAGGCPWGGIAGKRTGAVRDPGTGFRNFRPGRCFRSADREPAGI